MAASKTPSLDVEAATKVALRLLKARSRSVTELERALDAKACSEAVRRDVLRRLEGWGYVDDARFAKNRALALIREGRYGSAGVRSKLEAHGLAPELVQRALREAEVELGVDPLEVARAVLGKRALLGAKDTRGRARGARLLASRGFPESVIEAALGEAPLDPPAEDE